MSPSDWLGPAATVAAAIITGTVALAGVLLQRSREQIGQRRLVGSGKQSRRWIVASAVVAIPLTAFSARLAWPWGALVPAVVYTAVLTAAAAAWRRARPKLSQHAHQFIREQVVNEGGFPYDRETLPDLVVVYTDSDLSDANRSVQAPIQQQQSAQAKDPSKQQRVSFAKVLTDASYLHLAITGEAGVGKTSLLQFWVHELDPRQPRTRAKLESRMEQRLRQYVPVLIAARKLVGKESVNECFRCADGTELLARPPGSGLRWLVMIDAFDEITDMRDREQVERIVFEAIDQAGGSNTVKFVLTTRGLTPERWRSFDSRGVTEFRLQPFTFQQLRTFLVRRQTSVRDRTPDSLALAAAEAKADQFLKKWERADNLAELLRLPLLASVAAAVYFEGDRPGGFPSRRVDIYEDAVAHWLAQFRQRLEGGQAEGGALALLSSWDTDTDEIIETKAQRFLGELAHKHLADGQRSITQLACELLGIRLRPKDPRKMATMRALLEATGLIYEMHDDQPRFLHKTFAEYLAAPSQAEQFQSIEDWSGGFDDPERRAGTVFAFNHLPAQDRRELIDTALAERQYAVMCGWIAAEGLCVPAEDGRVDPEARAALIDRCLDSMPGAPDDRWWAVVRILATLEHAQNRLFQFVESGAWSGETRSQFAAELANHSVKGIDLLRTLLDRDPNGVGSGLDAAKDLFRYDRLAALERIRHLASSPRVPDHRRVEAAAVLADHDPETGLELLRKYTSDFTLHESYHAIAADHLAKHSEAEGVAALKAFVDNTGFWPIARASAAGYLAKYERTAGVAQLRTIASNRLFNAMGRAHAAEELVEYDRQEALGMLLALATDPAVEDSGRVRAAHFLARHSPELGTPLLRQFAARSGLPSTWRVEAARVLAELASSGAPLLELITDLESDDWSRAQAAAALVRFDRAAGVKLLRGLTEDPSISYLHRSVAARDLGELDRTAATSVLRSLAAEEGVDAFDRIRVGWQLCDLDDSLGPKILAEAASNDSYSDGDRIVAARHLLSHDPKLAIHVLQEMADDPARRPVDRANAAIELARQNPSTAASALLDFSTGLRTFGAARVNLLQAAAQYDLASAASALETLADDPAVHGHIQVEAASNLARLGQSAGLVILARQIADPTLQRTERVEAAQWLARSGHDEGAEGLRRFAADATTTDVARVNAAASVCEFDLAFGQLQLVECAHESAAQAGVRIAAAATLAQLEVEEGRLMLREAVDDRQTPEHARVDAASRLESEREALEILERFANDASMSDYGRCLAAIQLSRSDPYNALPFLRKVAAAAPPEILASVLAAERIADIKRAEGMRQLESLTSDAHPQLIRVSAAGALALHNPAASLPLLRSFATHREFDDIARVEAAGNLALHDRLAGFELLTAIMEDVTVDGLARVCAADALAISDLLRSLNHLQANSTDPTLDDIARITAMRFRWHHEPRAALKQLKTAFADSTSSGTARAWAGITLVELEHPVAADTAQAMLKDEPINADRLRKSARSLALRSSTIGSETERWISMSNGGDSEQP
jgi:hypothetical protein